jgi:uncharacterized membrane protein YfcA
MSPFILFLCSLGLLAGSTVKGVVGIGMPLVAVPILTMLVSLKTAVTLTTVPVTAANLVQSFQGGLFVPMLRRFWTLLLPLLLTILFSVRLLVVLPERLLDLIIGLAVIAFPVFVSLRPAVRLPPRHEAWLNPLVGVAAGLLGGISTFYGPPLMLYVFGMKLSKEEFIPAISIMYVTAGVGLLLGLWVMGVASHAELGLSVLMLIPTGIGMWLGRHVHVQLSERAFQRVLLCVYIATGLTFLANAALRG